MTTDSDSTAIGEHGFPAGSRDEGIAVLLVKGDKSHVDIVSAARDKYGLGRTASTVVHRVEAKMIEDGAKIEQRYAIVTTQASEKRTAKRDHRPRKSSMTRTVKKSTAAKKRTSKKASDTRKSTKTSSRKASKRAAKKSAGRRRSK